MMTNTKLKVEKENKRIGSSWTRIFCQDRGRGNPMGFMKKSILRWTPCTMNYVVLNGQKTRKETLSNNVENSQILTLQARLYCYVKTSTACRHMVVGLCVR